MYVQYQTTLDSNEGFCKKEPSLEAESFTTFSDVIITSFQNTCKILRLAQINSNEPDSLISEQEAFDKLKENYYEM